jgi:hypothetical protein
MACAGQGRQDTAVRAATRERYCSVPETEHDPIGFLFRRLLRNEIS